MYIIFITYTECISLTEKSGLSYRRRNWNCKKKKIVFRIIIKIMYYCKNYLQ